MRQSFGEMLGTGGNSTDKKATVQGIMFLTVRRETNNFSGHHKTQGKLQVLPLRKPEILHNHPVLSFQNWLLKYRAEGQ